jgi:hypothetical protein
VPHPAAEQNQEVVQRDEADQLPGPVAGVIQNVTCGDQPDRQAGESVSESGRRARTDLRDLGMRFGSWSRRPAWSSMRLLRALARETSSSGRDRAKSVDRDLALACFAQSVGSHAKALEGRVDRVELHLLAVVEPPEEALGLRSSGILDGSPHFAFSEGAEFLLGDPGPAQELDPRRMERAAKFLDERRGQPSCA